MSYALIDPIIYGWAKKHSLQIFTSFKDEEVRSADIVSTKGERFQIWIDQPLGTRIKIHAWNYRKTKKEWDVEVSDLHIVLEEALQAVKKWMS